jgi:hypothetical protein
LDPEDGANTFLRNVGEFITDYMASYSRRRLFMLGDARTSNSKKIYFINSENIIPQLLN